VVVVLFCRYRNCCIKL